MSETSHSKLTKINNINPILSIHKEHKKIKKINRQSKLKKNYTGESLYDRKFIDSLTNLNQDKVPKLIERTTWNNAENYKAVSRLNAALVMLWLNYIRKKIVSLL